MTAAALLTALAGLPARSDSPPLHGGTLKDGTAAAAASCQTGPDRHGYAYCGAHWKLSKLPVRFVLNTSGSPATVGASQFEQAARQAVAVWDAAATAAGTGPRPGGCSTARVVCIERLSNMAVRNSQDGVNVIRWDSVAGDPLASAYVTSDTGGRISDVDIVLNSHPSRSWYWFGEALVTGVAAGAVAYFCPVCDGHADVQSILMHEIGHALGLEHPNPGSPATWPSDAADAPDYNLVMYERYYPNNATQRALQWGDVAGLSVVLRASSSDP